MAISGPFVIGGIFGDDITTLAFHPSVAIPNGAILFVAVADVVPPVSISDTAGNVYLLAAASNEGGQIPVSSSLYVVQGTKQLRTTDTITVTFPSVTQGAIGGLFFTGALNQVHSGSSGFGLANPTGVACPAAAGDVLVAMICINGPASDGFTQDPNFSSDFGSGVSSSNYSIHGGTKSALLAGTFVYQPTIGADRPWIALMASFA